MKAKKNTFQATQRIIKRQYVTQTKPGNILTSGVSGGKMTSWENQKFAYANSKAAQSVEHFALNPKLYITKTHPCNLQQFSAAVKMIIFR